MVNQYYEAEVVSEYVIRGNTAVLKCNIPSFVADFVRVDAWVGSNDQEYLYSDEYGILLTIIVKLFPTFIKSQFVPILDLLSISSNLGFQNL